MGFFDKLLGREKAAEPAGPQHSVEELARRSGLSAEQLRGTLVKYHEMAIAKRSGGKRILQVPSPELKAVQRKILRKVLGKLAAHADVHGFERGRSIVTNALPHVGKRVIIKMDIRDFFPATQAKRVQAYFRAIGWDKEAAGVLVRLCTHQDSLPQGAPTSPRLANLVNYKMDARLSALSKSFGAVYTRYADDLTFSFEHDRSDAKAHARAKTVARNPQTQEQDSCRLPPGQIIRHVKDILQEYGYKVHQKRKLVIARQADRMQVTGLVVNQTVNLPRTVRPRLRAAEHHLKNNLPATLTLDQLAGWNSLRAMIFAQRQIQ